MKKVNVGKNTKECFTEMGEYRRMQDGLWGQIMQLDSPKVQKSMEELRHRYCKNTFHKITEHNSFKCTFKRVIFSLTCVPLDHSLTLDKTHIL